MCRQHSMMLRWKLEVVLQSWRWCMLITVYHGALLVQFNYLLCQAIFWLTWTLILCIRCFSHCEETVEWGIVLPGALWNPQISTHHHGNPHLNPDSKHFSNVGTFSLNITQGAFKNPYCPVVFCWVLSVTAVLPGPFGAWASLAHIWLEAAGAERGPVTHPRPLVLSLVKFQTDVYLCPRPRFQEKLLPGF